MSSDVTDTAEHDVLLEGGPADMADVWHFDHDVVQHVKVPCRVGTAHYEFSGTYRQLDGRSLPVYRWEYTTKVAE